MAIIMAHAQRQRRKADPSCSVCTPEKLLQLNFARAMRDTRRSSVQKNAVVLGIPQALLQLAMIVLLRPSPCARAVLSILCINTTVVCCTSVVHRRWFSVTELYLASDTRTYHITPAATSQPICSTRKVWIRECGEELADAQILCGWGES